MERCLAEARSASATLKVRDDAAAKLIRELESSANGAEKLHRELQALRVRCDAQEREIDDARAAQRHLQRRCTFYPSRFFSSTSLFPLS